MRILVVNAGSSSLKSQLIETDGKVSLMKCLAEKVGTPDAYMNVSFAPDFQKATYRVADMTVAECLKKLLEVLVDDPESPISDLSQIDAIGNRIVAGGEYFTKSVIIDEPAREKLELCEELAPLHNPPADACIDMMAALMPSTPQVAVFDTAFHATMPPKAYMYPLPARYYDDYRIRRYGAHGTSHRYAAQQAANLLGRPLRDLGLITCHLGNGGSITAVNHGKSIDTTMGFTPLEGLMMGTRSGSIDPAILTYIMRREGISFDEMDAVLNRESGVLGVLRAVGRHARRAGGGRCGQRAGAVGHRHVRVPGAEGHRRLLRGHDPYRRRGDDRRHRRELRRAARAHLRGAGSYGHDPRPRAQPRGGPDWREPHHLHR